MTPARQAAWLVAFDLDGTLIDSLADLASAANTMLAQLAPGAAPLSPAEIRGFVGDGAGKLASKTLAARGLASKPEALPVFLEAYRRALLDQTRLYDGVLEMLDALRPSHTLAVLSNKPGEMCRAILQGLGVADRFARIWGGDDAPKKPDPAGLSMLVRELGATPATTVMVGDSPNDLRAGRAAGVRGIGVTYGFDPAGVLAENPELVVRSPAELLGLLRTLRS